MLKLLAQDQPALWNGPAEDWKKTVLTEFDGLPRAAKLRDLERWSKDDPYQATA